MNILIRAELPVPVEITPLFLDNLIHDSAAIRKTASIGLKKLIYLTFPTKKEINIESNNSTLYQPIEANDCAVDEQTFNTTTFIDKGNIGYFGTKVPFYRTTIQVDKGKPDQLIAIRFQDQTYLDAIFRLYSLEEDGPNDKLIIHTSKLWKYLFKSFGLFNHEQLFPRIEKLFDKKKSNYDKLALDILYGMSRASKYFNFTNFSTMKDFLMERIFAQHLTSFSSESYSHWKEYFEFMKKRDIRRYFWVFQCLHKNIFINVNEESECTTISPYYR